MILSQLDIELFRYSAAFTEFMLRYQLPKVWFTQPDHFAIKCANGADYAATCAELRSEVNPEGMWEIEMDQRMLASAQLTNGTALGGYNFQWIEIMQPRPGKETKKGFIEHTEFVFPDFDQITGFFEGLDVEVELQDNPGHAWVNIIIDNEGREIKLNDRSLEAVAEYEKSEGLLHKLF